MASPDTDAITPLTQALPFADVEGDVEGEAAAELVGPAALGGLVVFDAPQAATDSAVAPVSVKIANRVSRAEVTDIEVLSGWPCNASHNWWRS
ncbi:MAG TPA: hypothetical protein VMB04_06445 [Mycobacterium sp.]|nr:hypothetical protein [Mycobacterium sp.]